MKTKLREVSRDELFDLFKEKPLVQRRRKKDGEPMVNSYGDPVMEWNGKPEEVPAETRAALESNLAREDVDGMIVFENLQMDSSAFGRRTAMIYGPGCTYKKPEDCEGQHLNDLPSQRQYPQYVYRKKEQNA